MQNYIEPGEVIKLTISAGATAGDPVMVGNIKGVAAETIEAGEAGSIALVGVFDLSVKGHDGSANAAVSIGDQIYFNSAATPKLNKNNAGSFFGYALEAITSGGTDTIKVLIPQGPGPGTIDILAGAIGSSELATGAVVEAKIGTGAVTDTKIGSGAVTEAKIGTGAVTETKIGTGAISKTKLSGGFLKVTLAAGTDSAANVTVSGMATGDELVSVLSFTTAAAIATVADRTSEYVIGTGQLTKAAGTDERNNQLLIIWNDLTT